MASLGYAFLKEEEDFRDAAVQVFKLNAENHPESFAALSNLGTAYEKMGNIEKSRNNFENALRHVKETDDPEWEFYQTDLENLNSKE